MRGRLRAERSAYERALYGAWQGERFSREEKLQPFKRYLSQAKATNTAQPSQTPMEALAVFHGLQSAGIPIKITRIT
ncbi:hypothetical protein [Sphingomonas aerolata]|uniref:hypothetical protein n=1 Tax=Sphingomonas aerolata TaxID=185951 RepID=UPI002FE26B07